MNKMRNKIFSLLVLLTVAASVWADNYYVIGTMNDWGPSKQFQLTQNPANDKEYMITLSLKAGAELKVIGVDGEGNWTWYPGGSDPNYVENTAGKYTIYFRPDGQGGDGWYYGCIYLAAAPAPAIPVTDLGNNEWEFTMPTYAVVANIEYDTELELQETNVNTTVLADWDGYEADVTLSGRTLSKGGNWNTLCLPFSLGNAGAADGHHFDGTPLEGAIVKELNNTASGSGFDAGTGTLTLKFTTANSIEAGKPYIVKWENASGTVSNPVFNGVTIDATAPKAVTSDDGKVTFVGQYSPFSIVESGATGENQGNLNEIIMLSTGNKLGYSKNPRTLRSFRAHFEVPTNGGAPAARSFVINFDDGETTGISLTPDPSPRGEGSKYYTLDGRKLSGKPTKKGMYIHNGKKVVLH